MKENDTLPKRPRDTQELARLSARLLQLGGAGNVDAAERDLGTALDAAFELGNAAARSDFDEAAPVASAAVNPALTSPNKALRLLLAAWTDYVVDGVSDEEMRRIARVMLEFAGVMSWLSELEEAPAMLRFAYDECERNDGVTYELAAGGPEEAAVDAMKQSMESGTLTVALQHLSDMGCRGVGISFPGTADGWTATAITPCKSTVEVKATVDDGSHMLFVRLSNAVGKHLRGSGKQTLDS